VAVREGDGEAVGDVDGVATDATLRVGEGGVDVLVTDAMLNVGEGGVDVEIAALPQPTASVATSASAATFQ
jgi:hypothetical protein